MLEHFRDKEAREGFYRFFRELEELYEILSPDPFLRPYLEDYQRLVEMYRLLRTAYEPHVPVDKSFLRKTAEIVQRHTRADAVQEPRATYEIGPAALLALLNEAKPETVKVFNLLKELHRLVEEQGRAAPYLLSIGERAEAIRRRFEERQMESQEALRELEELVKQLKQAHEERASSPLSPKPLPWSGGCAPIGWTPKGRSRWPSGWSAPLANSPTGCTTANKRATFAANSTAPSRTSASPKWWPGRMPF